MISSQRERMRPKSSSGLLTFLFLNFASVSSGLSFFEDISFFLAESSTCKSAAKAVSFLELAGVAAVFAGAGRLQTVFARLTSKNNWGMGLLRNFSVFS